MPRSSRKDYKGAAPEKGGKKGPQGPQAGNLSGIMLTFASVALLALFLFGILTPAYRMLALAVPVTVLTVAALLASAAIGWEISRSQYED